MDSASGTGRYELLYVIVGSGTGSRVLHIAKRCGISGGVISLGRGTVKNSFLEKLALTDIRKEIVMMVADGAVIDRALEELGRELRLFRPHHGIAYSMPVVGVCGSRSCSCKNRSENGEAENTMYQSVMIIVDKGKGEAVVEAAAKAGSRGATIINARGSGVHETSKLFAMEIEPEKEIVLMITREDATEKIVSAIREDFQIEKPGNGVIFVQNVNKAYGLIE